MNEANDSNYSAKEVLERLADDYSMRIVETDSYDDDRVGFEKSAIYSLPLFVNRNLTVHNIYCCKVAESCLCCRWSGVLAARAAPSGPRH